MQIDKNNFKMEFRQRLVLFAVAILQLADELREDRNLRPLADQIIRSAGSVGANVSEAKGSSSKKDYTRFFEIALKSANETMYWLDVLSEYSSKYERRVVELRSELDEICRILAASIITLKDRK